jgi:hypothetical protein
MKSRTRREIKMTRKNGNGEWNTRTARGRTPNLP